MSSLPYFTLHAIYLVLFYVVAFSQASYKVIDKTDPYFNSMNNFDFGSNYKCINCGQGTGEVLNPQALMANSNSARFSTSNAQNKEHVEVR
jgi:hypothetical protein